MFDIPPARVVNFQQTTDGALTDVYAYCEKDIEEHWQRLCDVYPPSSEFYKREMNQRLESFRELKQREDNLKKESGITAIREKIDRAYDKMDDLFELIISEKPKNLNEAKLKISTISNQLSLRLSTNPSEYATRVLKAIL